VVSDEDLTLSVPGCKSRILVHNLGSVCHWLLEGVLPLPSLIFCEVLPNIVFYKMTSLEKFERRIHFLYSGGEEKKSDSTNFLNEAVGKETYQTCSYLRKKIYATYCKSRCLHLLTVFKVGPNFLREIRRVLKNCDTENESKLKNYEGLQIICSTAT
jgi:hypothetical protein